MTLRDQIEKQTKRYRRDLKISFILFIIGAIASSGMIGMIPSGGSYESIPVGRLILGVAIASSYGIGGLGVLAFGILLSITAKCPKCGKRFRTHRKDWNHCPFCGVNFDDQFHI